MEYLYEPGVHWGGGGDSVSGRTLVFSVFFIVCRVVRMDVDHVVLLRVARGVAPKSGPWPQGFTAGPP